MTNTGARRVTLREVEHGLWRYKVQGWNWRTIDSSGIGAQRRVVDRIIRREWPEAEVVVIARNGSQ